MCIMAMHLTCIVMQRKEVVVNVFMCSYVYVFICLCVHMFMLINPFDWTKQ
jgi:hypothetical protein